MTEGEVHIILAACARSAELWSLGNEYPAERWFAAAVDMLGTREFTDIDADQEADR